MAEVPLAVGLHRFETVMDMPVGIDARDDTVDPAALDRAFGHLHEVEAAFSPYRAESDVRRLDAGTLAGIGETGAPKTRGPGDSEADIATTSDSRDVLRASLREQLAALRGRPPDALPPALLDIRVRRVRVPGGHVLLVQPADWEQLRHEEGGAGRGAPYWATPWPSGAVLAGALAEDPSPAGTRVLELGCGLGLPSIVAARAGAEVLATDGNSDAVAFAAHSLAINELDAEVAQVDWTEQADALASRGPWDLVLAADVLYLHAGAAAALALMPRLVAPGGEILIADPRRAGARDFLAAARARFTVRSRQVDEIALHRLTPKPPRAHR